MPTIDGCDVQKEGQEKSKIQKKLKLWSLGELERRQEFVEGVNNTYHGIKIDVI